MKVRLRPTVAAAQPPRSFRNSGGEGLGRGPLAIGEARCVIGAPALALRGQKPYTCHWVLVCHWCKCTRVAHVIGVDLVDGQIKRTALRHPRNRVAVVLRSYSPVGIWLAERVE
jgi:hypothetical protein